ncbi:MAG: lipocalin-like domain-containing protein [Tractidigestivibacter sp.]|jgi:hypothetical protein|uniref:lipocalin-like domain-containing protein n=1 Tax=Tractidigestivibacter sp. TaxID=2847320 RepID=UPI003D939E25
MAASKTARLLNRPEDFERLGVSPNRIETWEDARRNRNTGKGQWEWWYFDSILDDGSQAVAQFFTKAGLRKANVATDAPGVTVQLTRPDGTEKKVCIDYKPEECSYGSDKCDVHMGRSEFVGDFKTYHIVTEEKDGVALDLTLTSRSKPYRPGSAYFGFEGDEYFTWLCCVPQGEVSGTVTMDGQTREVHGTGYHDHQWGNNSYVHEWNHWVWARQSFGDYSALVFDMVASKEYGYKRFPIVFVQNNRGDVVFESIEGVNCDVLGEFEEKEASGKVYPTGVHYEFEDSGKHLSYELREKRTLRAEGVKSLPLAARLAVKGLHLNLSYARFLADGKMCLEIPGGQKIERSGELIYEFMYPGETFKGHM